MVGLGPVTRHFELPAGMECAPVVLAAVDEPGLQCRIGFTYRQWRGVGAQRAGHLQEDIRGRHADLQAPQVMRLVNRVLHVVEAARAGVVDGQPHQAAPGESLAHDRARGTVDDTPHVRDRFEYVGQDERTAQRKGVVECCEVDARDVQRTRAGQFDGVAFATELAGVVDADPQATLGSRLELPAHPAHGFDCGVLVDMHVRGGEHSRLRRRSERRMAQSDGAGRQEEIAALHAGWRIAASGSAAIMRQRSSPHPSNARRALCPTRMSCTPVIMPVEIYAPARSGRPSEAALLAANASASSVACRATLPRPTSFSSIHVATWISAACDCQSPISAPMMTPQLLPKSATTAPEPRSLSVASGLLATSTPMHMVPTSSIAVEILQSVRPAAASDFTMMPISASTAENPPANTGHSTTVPGDGRCTLCWNTGPMSRGSLYCADHCGGMRATFQPATSSGQRRSAALWQR